MLLLTGGLLAAGLLVDRRAESAFDAPKRLAAIVAVGVAAALIAAFFDVARAKELWLNASLPVRVSVAAFGAGLAGVLIAAIFSPRSAVSLATTRGTLILALAAPLAALLFDERAMRRALGAFVALAAINSIASLMQRSGSWKPWAIERISGRTESIGFFGNEGVLALAAALGAVIAAALWFDARGGMRALLAGAFALNVAGVVANASVTPILALGAGTLVLAVSRASGRQIAVGAAGLVIVAGVAFAALPQLRARVGEARSQMAWGDLDALTSYRFGAWAAAGEMIAARPLTGFGPGTFSSEFVVHRLAAETRWGRRLVNPSFAGGSYEDAHCDYLQVAAESGLVVTLLLGLGIGAAALALFRAARDTERKSRVEASTLLAVAVVIAVSALTWFPLQRPATALIALMTLGRVWALVPDDEEADA